MLNDITMQNLCGKYDDLMREIAKLHELTESEPNEWVCLLMNRPDAATGFYHRSHGLLRICISSRGDAKNLMTYINSIDDSAIVFFGPVEAEDKIVRRMERMVKQFKELGGWVPTYEQAQQIAQATGTYLDIN